MEGAAVEWAFHELLDTELGDARRTDRLIAMVEAFAFRPQASPSEALGDPHQAKAAYRFWDTESCTVDGILSGHVRRTHQRCATCQEVLVVQDSTEFNYTSHRSLTGLGYTSRPQTQGVKGHASLAVAPDGDVLGVLDLFLWTRPNEERGRRAHRNRRTTDQKETARWLRGVRAADEALPTGGRAIVIGDAEADVFDLFAAPRAPGVELLVRARHTKRLVDHPLRYVLDVVLTQPLGTTIVEIPRADGRPGRQATLVLYAAGATVPPPQNHPRRGATPITVHWVLAREEGAPPGVTAVSWLLATTLPIAAREEAIACLDRYRLRWRIERFFYVLKQGCAVEKLELQNVERLKRALATYAIVAWRVLYVLYHAHAHPDEDSRRLFHEEELRLLAAAGRRSGTGPQPITNAQAVRQLARLGGHLGRTRDAPPGVKALWRGLRRLTDQLQGYLIAQAEMLIVGNA
jgi:hypothetical protein